MHTDKLPPHWAIQVRFGVWAVKVDCIHLNPVRPMSLQESEDLMAYYQARSSLLHRLAWDESH